MNWISRAISILKAISAAFLLILCVGCGYQLGLGELSRDYSTVSIPYIEGDWDGEFTAILIHQMSRSGALKYTDCVGDLQLLVRVIDQWEDDISFRYDRTGHGRFRRYVVPDETRMTMTVEVTLIETASDRIILGPARLMGIAEFDHDYYSSRGGVNVFSLGQLTDIEEAEDAAMIPLFRNLSQKIVDFVKDSW